MASFDMDDAYSLSQVVQANAPNGKFMSVIDVLKGQYPFIEEMHFVEANDKTSHTFLRSVSEPSGALVTYNTGAPFEGDNDKPITEQMTRWEANFQIDERVLKKSNDPIRYRREREKKRILGGVKFLHTQVFKGDMGADPKSINGLYKRYGTVDTAAGSMEGSVQSLGASTGTTNSSIWIVKHGPEDFFGFYPAESGGGIEEEDWGRETALDGSGNPYKVFRTHWAWEYGIGIGRPKCIQRICNISLSGANSFFEDASHVGTTLGERALIDALERIPDGLDNTVIYVGGPIMGQIRKRLNEKANVFWSPMDVWGRKVLSFNEVPIKRVDTLLANESVVS